MNASEDHKTALDAVFAYEEGLITRDDLLNDLRHRKYARHPETGIIQLSRLNGTAEAAEQHLNKAVVGKGTDIVRLEARAASSVSDTFIQALLAGLQRNGVSDIALVGGSNELLQRLQAAAPEGMTVRPVTGDDRYVVHGRQFHPETVDSIHYAYYADFLTEDEYIELLSLSDADPAAGVRAAIENLKSAETPDTVTFRVEDLREPDEDDILMSEAAAASWDDEKPKNLTAEDVLLKAFDTLQVGGVVNVVNLLMAADREYKFSVQVREAYWQMVTDGVFSYDAAGDVRKVLHA